MAKQYTTRIVIDSNQLSSDRLAEFLSASPNHRAIITDYAWMEAYKADSIPILQKSFSVLGKFPAQVDHLWGTKKISAMDFRGAALGDMMVRRSAARDFMETLSTIEKLDPDGTIPLSKLTPHVGAARAHIEGRLLKDMEETQSAFPLMEGFFTDDQKRLIRRREPLDGDIIDRVMLIVQETSKRLAKRHPEIPRGSTPKSYFNSFITRYAVSAAIYLLEWIRQGSQMNVSLSKTLNDLIDINFAIYGTYFNGIMTSDKKLEKFHQELRVVLGFLRARMPEDHSHL